MARPARADAPCSQVLPWQVVGGVTLNHLSWAAALGVPTALAAVQGEDEPGRSIRTAMAAHGISDGALSVRPGVSSSVSHVLLEESGERTILMAPHATATLDGAEVNASFVPALDNNNVQLVTTEVSQAPLEGVGALIGAATARGIPTMLDVDVPPSIAAGAARRETAPATQCHRSARVTRRKSRVCVQAVREGARGARSREISDGAQDDANRRRRAPRARRKYRTRRDDRASRRRRGHAAPRDGGAAARGDGRTGGRRSRLGGHGRLSTAAADGCFG